MILFCTGRWLKPNVMTNDVQMVSRRRRGRFIPSKRVEIQDRDATLLNLLDKYHSRSAFSSALVVGCATSASAGQFFSRHAIPCTAVDEDAAQRDIFVKTAGKVWVTEGSASTLALGHPFDVIVAWDILRYQSHSELSSIFRNFRRHASRNATLILRTNQSAEPDIASLLKENSFDQDQRHVADDQMEWVLIWTARFSGG